MGSSGPAVSSGARRVSDADASYAWRMGTEALSLFGVGCAVIIFVIAAIVIVFL